MGENLSTCFFSSSYYSSLDNSVSKNIVFDKRNLNCIFFRYDELKRRKNTVLANKCVHKKIRATRSFN